MKKPKNTQQFSCQLFEFLKKLRIMCNEKNKEQKNNTFPNE